MCVGVSVCVGLSLCVGVGVFSVITLWIFPGAVLFMISISILSSLCVFISKSFSINSTSVNFILL